LGIAVFLVIGLIFLNFWAVGFPRARGEKGILGGPDPAFAAMASQGESVLVGQPIADLSRIDSGDDSPASGNQENLFSSGLVSAAAGPGDNPQNQAKTAKANNSSGNVGRSDAKSYFVFPARGFNWGKLHPNNAVDIANSCGTAIVAAAEGLVTDISMDAWGGGYGHYVVIAHLNGTKTRSAHLDEIFVAIGQYVKQSELIGTMGRTGDATGCHLHFEVEGAANPFAR